jgi:hypothetical protein
MLETIKALVMSRGTQLLSRYIGVGLTMLAGKASVEIPAADAAGTSNTVALLIGAGVCLLMDLIAHSLQKTEAKK